MALLDGYLSKITEYLEELAALGRPVRTFHVPADMDRLRQELPVRVGPGAHSGLILREDTQLELGSPDTASCAFPLWTADPSQIRDGRITLVGPSIRDAPGASLPFGQVLLAAGRNLGEADHAALEQSQYVADQIEGYMIRSTPGRMWCRVSRAAAERGFDFEALGGALFLLLRSGLPRIEALEVVFVTSGADDVRRLLPLADQVATISRNITRDTWRAKGFDLECTLDVDCRACSDRPACDEIRDVVKIRRKKVRTGRVRNQKARS